MQNKTFTIIKIGYSSGVYGCSNEYFTLIYTDKKESLKSQSFYGMYGSSERVSAVMKDKGYKEKYTQSFFGRMTRKDLTKNCISEHSIINDYIKYIK